MEDSDPRKFALMIHLQAIPGKEPEVEALRRVALLVAQEEHATNSWLALRFDVSTFGMFSTFPNEDSLEDHPGGPHRNDACGTHSGFDSFGHDFEQQRMAELE